MKVAMLLTDNREEFHQYERPEPFFGPAPAALLEGLAQSSIELHILSCTKKPMRAPEKVAENMWFHLLHVGQGGWLRTCYSGCIFALRNKLRELKPDIVHGQGTERYCGLAAALSGFPNIITIHGNMRSIAKVNHAAIFSYEWCAARLEQFTLPRTDGVICNSLYTERMVESRAPKTWRVPNALRSIFFQKLAQHVTNPKPFLLNVGTIASHKCQIEILKTARKLFRAGHRFELWFVGNYDQASPYASKFIDLVTSAEQEGFARYLGTRSEDDLQALFDQADALIHFPSEEAFGLVVAEALARNLKFFGCRTGGVADIAETVEGAELYRRNDWTGLYNGLARWMEADREKPSSAAGEMCRRYHPATIAKRHVEIYNELGSAGMKVR